MRGAQDSINESGTFKLIFHFQGFVTSHVLGFTKLKSKNKVEASHLLKLKEDPEKRKKKQRRNNEEEEGATLCRLRWVMWRTTALR